MISKLALMFGLMCVSLSSVVVAHEIPPHVQVRVYVMATEDTLDVAMRVPLSAMRDFDFPQTQEGFLALDSADSSLHDAADLWLVGEVVIYENGRVLDSASVNAVVASPPSNRAFDSARTAFARFSTSGNPDAKIPLAQANLDVSFSVPITSQNSRFSLQSAWSRLGLETLTSITVMSPGGGEHTLHFSGDPGLVHLQPNWLTAAGIFIKLGFNHLLDGWDHLLLVVCLVMPLRAQREIIISLLSFSTSYAIALWAMGLSLVPTPLWFIAFVEAGVALSVLYLAVENGVSFNTHRRWMTAFAIGGLLGLASGAALVEALQLAVDQMLGAMIAFNLGVELALLLVAGLAALGCHRMASFGYWPQLVIVASLLVAHSAWHWLIERIEQLSLYTLSLPVWGLQAGFDALRWLTLVAIAALVFTLLSILFKRNNLH